MTLVHHSLVIYLAFLLVSIFSYTDTTRQTCQTNNGHELSCNHGENKYAGKEFTDEELFARGHLKPFGSHRPPEIVEELSYMISPEDFYMKYVAKHKPVVIKGMNLAIFNMH